MNHPTPETWVEYLYGELSAAAEGDCRRHLESCPQCRARVEEWKATQRLLDADRATLAPHSNTSPGRRVAFSLTALPWAAAIAVLLGLGFIGGRLSGASRRELQAELVRTRDELRAEFQTQQAEALRTTAAAAAAANSEETRRFLNAFAGQLQTARIADRRDFLQAIRALDEQHQVDLGVLRSDLGQLARTTGSGFRQAESQFNLIASQLPAEPAPGPSPSRGPVPAP
jgi:anti-sigma factor RsiW